jgi:hypothetical protein
MTSKEYRDLGLEQKYLDIKFHFQNYGRKY